MSASPAAVFVVESERAYLDGVKSALIDYGDRVEVLVGIPSEMQLPADRGIQAAYAEAVRIAQACGYLASCPGGNRLVLHLASGDYVLFWDDRPGFEHLLYSVTDTDTLNTRYPGRMFPELWARLEQGRGA